MIHRLVALNFISNPNNYTIVDHIDGNRSNNDINNLRLVTQSENMNNAQNLGHKGQESVIQYSLSGEELETYESIQKAADKYYVTNAAIRSAIIRGGSSCGFKWSFKE